MSRFVVTEIEGYSQPTPSGNARSGLSCQVIDTKWNYRLMATFRSEELRGNRGKGFLGGSLSNEKRFAIIRERAAALAQRLNEQTPA